MTILRLIEKIISGKDTLMAYIYWAIISIKSTIGIKKVNSNQKKLLLLAWAFPPNMTGGVYRPEALVKYGSELGWEFTIISGPIENNPSSGGIYHLQALPTKGVSIARLRRPRLRPSWNYFPKVDGGFLNALSTFCFAIKLFKNEKPPSIVMATGPTFHNFVAAYYIARYFRTKLILDYRDGWTVDTQSFIDLGNVDCKWEKRCIRSSDAIFFVTNSHLELYRQTFNDLDISKCRVIENGWDPLEFSIAEGFNGVNIEKNGKLVISHFGVMGRHLGINNFFKIVEKVLERREDLRKRIILYFVGAGKEGVKYEEEFNYKEIIKIIEGRIPKPAAIKMMEESSALLLINSPNLKATIHGKLYDYIASGKPILAIGEAGEVGRIIVELGVGFLISNENDKTLEEVLDLLVKGEDIKFDRQKVSRWLSNHTRQVMVSKMVRVFNQLIT